MILYNFKLWCLENDREADYFVAQGILSKTLSERIAKISPMLEDLLKNTAPRPGEGTP